MKIKSTRFGELEVDKSDIITIKEGLLGFESLKKYFVVDPGDQTLILWLQSVDREEIAFPIIEPKIFQSNYQVKLSPVELASLEMENLEGASIYTILTIPSDVTQMSANLKAPIVINTKTKSARQIVLQDSKLEVKHSMYLELKKHIVSYSSDDTVRSNKEKATPSAQQVNDSENTQKENNTAQASKRDLEL